MKLHHFVTAAALPMVCIGASAQSSVTLFGVVDVNVRYVRNQNLPGNLSMNNSGLTSGQLGFKGTEDLGGGLQAGFWLESDLNADTGTYSSTGKFFQRRSTVSLSGGFGELRLGRDLSPASAHTYRYDPFSTLGLGNSNATSRLPNGMSPATFYRQDNAIQYFTPGMGGMRAELMYAPDENPASNDGRHMAARLVYDNGPLSLSLSYGNTEVSAGRKFKQYGAGAAYDFGVAKLMGFFQRDDMTFGTYGATTLGPEDRWLLGVTVPAGTGYFRASYVRTDSRKGSAAFNGSDANKYALGYVYEMSRRTALYGTVARITNKGGANFALSGGAQGIAAGANSTGAEVGIRHSF